MTTGATRTGGSHWSSTPVARVYGQRDSRGCGCQWHGEGKFVTDNKELLDIWSDRGQIAVRYVDPETNYPSISDEVLPYPISPNQSWRNIAGVCDQSGLVFGLMPHPEANHSTWLGATWTREDVEHGEGEGMAIFRNAVDYVLSRSDSV